MDADDPWVEGVGHAVVLPARVVLAARTTIATGFWALLALVAVLDRS
jgi:hypothetical protein